MMDKLDLCERSDVRSDFRNAEWRLDGEGLEHRGTGYVIAADSLGRRRAEGLWDWPLHMAEKAWCTPSLFREAFLVALDRHGVARDEGLSESFALGFGIRAARSASAEAGFALLGDLVRPRMRAPGRPAVASAEATQMRGARVLARSAARI